MERILTSKKGDRVIALKRLAEKAKERRAQGLYLVDGIRLVGDAMDASVVPKSLLISPAVAEGELGKALTSRAHQLGCELVLADEDVLRHITGSPSTQGVLAVMPRVSGGVAPAKPQWVVSLHAVQDPGNVGTLLRSAAAAGVDQVLLDSDCADPYGLKAVRASAGALWRSRIEILGDLEKPLLAIKKSGLKLIATVAGEGRSHLDEILSTPFCLMIGSEGKGLPPKIKDLSDFQLTIDYPGSIESLNASTSAAIILFEALRQRKKT